MPRVLPLLLVLLVACGGGGEPVAGGAAGSPSPGGSPTSPSGGDASASAAADLVGTLGGDAALEGGCVWIESDGTRYEVVFPDGYTATADPVEVRGPDGEVVASAGDQLALEGAEATDVVTICQIGPVFEATAVRPVP